MVWYTMGMKLNVSILLIALIGSVTLPQGLLAQGHSSFISGADSSLEAVNNFSTQLQGLKQAADEDVVEATNQLLAQAKAFQKSVRESKNPQNASREDYWKLVRQRRHLDTLMSVSSLRKNADLKGTLKKVDKTLAELKPLFQ